MYFHLVIFLAAENAWDFLLRVSWFNYVFFCWSPRQLFRHCLQRRMTITTCQPTDKNVSSWISRQLLSRTHPKGLSIYWRIPETIHIPRDRQHSASRSPSGRNTSRRKATVFNRRSWTEMCFSQTQWVMCRFIQIAGMWGWKSMGVQNRTYRVGARWWEIRRDK